MTFIIESENEKQQKETLKRNRLSSLASVFSKTLSVLTTHKISVSVVDKKEMNAPAWSSTKEVWLNNSVISDDFSARGITSLNGLALHECAHLRYTPRNGSNLVGLIKQEQKQNELWEAFNCLEDSRIEYLMTGWLPSIKSWLTATMCDYLLNDDEAITRAFPLVYGRKYLPVELRQLASDKFVKPELLNEFAVVIDDYNSLILTGNDENTDHAFNLIKRFSELLNELPQLPQDPNGQGEGEGEGTTVVRVRIKNPHGHEGRPTQGYESSSNRPANKSEQERNQQSAKKNVVEVTIDTTPKEETKEESVSEGKNPSDTQSNTQSQSESQSQSDTQSKDNSFGDDVDDFGDEDFGDFFDDSDFDDVQSQSDKPLQSKSAGNAEGETGTNQQVTDILNDIISNAIDSLSKDINSIAKQIGINPELLGGNAKTPEKANYNEVTIPNDLTLLAKNFGVELERLRADFDPAWLNGEASGKLNANRYLLGHELDTVFDEWTEGRDDVTSIEAVILLDRSGSMSGNNADNAYKSMWAIKKALERVEARTTVVTFDYGTHLLYGADDKAGTTIRDSGASGGTNPESAILYAKRVLADSDKAIKILFMITDGAWDTQEGEKAVIEMKNAGVLTCQALISGYEVSAESLNQYRHGFELMTSMKSAKDILILGKELVRVAIGRNLVNA